MRRPTHVRHHRRGAAAVELAILLPFLAFMFLVAVDFCRVFYCSQTLQGCAETAALYASGYAKPPANTTATSAAQQAAVADGSKLDPALKTSDVSITSDSSAGTVTATVTYPFQTLTPFPGMGQTTTLVRTATVTQAPQAGQ